MAVKKNPKSPAFTVVIMLLLAAIIVGGYFMLNRSGDGSKAEIDKKMTECQKILDRDMETDYPGTVRELLKYYCRIMKCMINEEVTDDEFDSLVTRLRELFDEQLLAANPYDFHRDSLKNERRTYKNSESKINSFTVDSADKLVKRKLDGKECATLSLYFTIKNGTEFNRSFEEFLVRKDDKDCWRIFGWQSTEKGTKE